MARDNRQSNQAIIDIVTQNRKTTRRVIEEKICGINAEIDIFQQEIQQRENAISLKKDRIIILRDILKYLPAI
jgi:hypothetical protein